MPRKAASDKISKEIIAQYLTAELDSLTQRALQQENARATKINFYLVLATAVGGGLIIASGSTSLQRIILPLSTLIALIIHMIGWLTLSQGLDHQAGSIIFYRRLGRIRQWFLDAAPSILPYLPLQPGDNRPLFYVAYAPIRSIESILLLVNSIAAGVFVSLAWLFACYQVFQWSFILESLPLWIALGFGILASAVIWSLQVRYIRQYMLDREKWEIEHGRVHFPGD